MGLDVMFYKKKTDETIEELCYYDNDDNLVVKMSDTNLIGHLGRLGWGIIHNIMATILDEPSEYFVEITENMYETFDLDWLNYDIEELTIIRDIYDKCVNAIELEDCRIFVEYSY